MRQKRYKSNYHSLKTLSILAISLALVAGCTDMEALEQESNLPGQGQSMKQVKAFKVTKHKIADPLERAADVQSSVQFDIVAKTGGDVEQVLKKRGDMVHEGEVIVRLNSGEARYQRETAALAVHKAQDAIVKAKEEAKKEYENKRIELSSSVQRMEFNLNDLQRNYNKLRNDHDVGMATKAQLYQAEVQLMNARMDLEQLRLRLAILVPAAPSSELETQLKQAQIALQQMDQSMTYLEVKAPVNGILTELSLEAGMSLQTGALIGVIQKLDPIKIKAHITEDETKRIINKTELTYYLPGTKEKNKGSISFLSKIPDPQTKAYEVNLDVANKEMLLKPGMKLWLQLTEEQDQIVLSVPTYSVVKEGDDAFVFVHSDGTVEKRKLQLGRVNEPHQEVLAGVNEGELVVITSPDQLKDKEKVHLAAIEEQ